MDHEASHAITVHDGLIFDSNENFALTLCRENLDALCSTPLRQSLFKNVATGYIFRDQKDASKGEVIFFNSISEYIISYIL